MYGPPQNSLVRCPMVEIIGVVTMGGLISLVGLGDGIRE